MHELFDIATDTRNLTAEHAGKQIGKTRYVHVSCLCHLDSEISNVIAKAETLANICAGEHYNVLKLSLNETQVSLLNYPQFFEIAFPELRESWAVDLNTGTANHRNYTDSLNPPILHRKELLLPTDHPRRSEFESLTLAAESIGLFDNPVRIGFKQQWEFLLAERGYKIVDHSLLPLGNDESTTDIPTIPNYSTSISRHLTALARNNFSAPIQSLARYGFLDGSHTLFDYGCGRGDDIRGLKENGHSVAGWDPHYAPDSPIDTAHIVNLGFVINVIEDRTERMEALTRAYSLSEKLLVVSAMLANQNALVGQRFNDGILTNRRTFQKYYTQAELKQFIEETLGEDAIAVAPGIFYVFQDKDAEQRFLIERFQSRRNVLRVPWRPAAGTESLRRDRAAEKYAKYGQILEALWTQWLSLGREPDKTEVTNLLELIEGFGSLGRALRFLTNLKDISLIEHARQARAQDFEVYLALNLFERRKPYRHLDPKLQKDIKAFFGNYSMAQQAARDLLFGIADPRKIDEACTKAAEDGLGWYLPSESLQLHTSLVERLPPLLRVYVGCTSVLYGDYRAADLVKIHIRSGKVTLQKYDDFDNQPLPRMVERTKIKLREQDVDFYLYDKEEYIPPFLYFKSRYINEEFLNYPEQIEFEQTLETLKLFDFSGYGPKPDDFLKTLERHRWAVDGFRLVRSHTTPGLDEPCGRYLTYRQLIECGDTQQRIGLPNLPKEPETYTALYELVTNVLDPVIEYFGAIKLTYGFCSSELAKLIPGRIAPELDQHAAHEKNKRNRLTCERLGAAVDFLVEDENMLEVAEWVAANTRFDRLYYYAPNRPIHVSFGPEKKGELVEMRKRQSGQIIPHVRRISK